MQELFTFLENPYLVILNESLRSLPGIERVDLLFYNAINCKTELHSVQRKKYNQQIQNIEIEEGSIDILNSFRRKQTSQDWIGLNRVPYSSAVTNKIEQDLFSEFNSHVLCIALPNAQDHSKDIYFFYFRKNASDFGLGRSDRTLSTSNKGIIGHLLYHSIESQLVSLKHNQNSLRLINEQTHHILETKNELLQKNTQLKIQNKENLIQLTEFLINDLNTNGKDVYYLSSEAKELIGEFTGSVFDLKKQLSKAMSISKTLNFGTNTYEHLLKADFFNFTNSLDKSNYSPSLTESLSEENTKHQHSKTYEFLNDLEKSSKEVLHLGWKLTSSNVGHKFEKPITAAAISDKLKHHSSKILRLLDSYPAKWPLIRKRFRPVQNVIAKSQVNSIEKAS